MGGGSRQTLILETSYKAVCLILTCFADVPVSVIFLLSH